MKLFHERQYDLSAALAASGNPFFPLSYVIAPAIKSLVKKDGLLKIRLFLYLTLYFPLRLRRRDNSRLTKTLPSPFTERVPERSKGG
jgi:hypothetical protein